MTLGMKVRSFRFQVILNHFCQNYELKTFFSINLWLKTSTVCFTRPPSKSSRRLQPLPNYTWFRNLNAVHSFQRSINVLTNDQTVAHAKLCSVLQLWVVVVGVFTATLSCLLMQKWGNPGCSKSKVCSWLGVCAVPGKTVNTSKHENMNTNQWLDIKKIAATFKTFFLLFSKGYGRIWVPLTCTLSQCNKPHRRGPWPPTLWQQFQLENLRRLKCIYI